ncbi:hypothetical protein FRB94_007442 [Tulasnella sp. JGI-2019a]|nr:hypothetical protein FRB94_007442 [Tulasnella sp. JGI-2019a]
MNIPTTGQRQDQKPGVFGDRGGFWIKYDELAGAYDKDMLARLNGNLDVLLIFAGLFSAINTAFIIVTLAALSAASSDRTNALLVLILLHRDNSTLTPDDLNPPFVPTPGIIRQNCMFFASLCSSLLAAAGAMRAKQWLQYYERTGQTGALDKQGLERTAKFMGVESWGLRPIVEFLPTLLLVSLGLFFAALVDYLWNINQRVAMVVLVFAAVGAGINICMGMAANIWPRCPFQTSVGFRGLSPFGRVWDYRDPLIALMGRLMAFVADHQSMRRPLRVIRKGMLLAQGACKFVPLFALGDVLHSIELVYPWIHQWLVWNTATSDMDMLRIGSAIWMAETAPESEILRIVAQNIPYITSFRAMQLVTDSPMYLDLIYQANASLAALQTNPLKESIGNTLTFARAIAHILLASGTYDYEWDIVKRTASTPYDQSPSAASQELMILWPAIVAQWCQRYTVLGDAMSVLQGFHEWIEGEGYRQGMIFLHSVITALPSILNGSPVVLVSRPKRRTALIDVEPMVTLDELVTSMGDLLLMDIALHDDVLCSVALALSHSLARSSGIPQWLVKHSSDHRIRHDPVEDVLDLLTSHDGYFTSFRHFPDGKLNVQLLRCQSLVLRRFRTLHPSWADMLPPNPQPPSIMSGLPLVLRAYSIVSTILLEVSEALTFLRQQSPVPSAVLVELVACENELLQTLRCLLRTSFPSPVDIDGLDATIKVILGLEAHEEIVDPIVDVCAYAMESLRVFHGTSPQTFLGSHPAYLPLLTRCILQHTSSAESASSKGLLGLVRASYYPDGANAGFKPLDEMTLLLAQEHVFSAAIDFLARRSRRRDGTEPTDESSSLINWLTEMVRHHSLDLFIGDVSKLLVEFKWNEDEGLQAALAMLFLEVWGNSQDKARGSGTQNPTTFFRMSSTLIEVFAAALRSVDHIAAAISSPSVPVTTHMPSTNYALTFRFAEHSLRVNTWAAITHGLDTGCERLARRLRDDHPNADGLREMWLRTKASYETLRPSLRRNVLDVEWWKDGGLAAVCRTPPQEIL